MRRFSTTTQDPDVEEAEAHLAHLEGKKETVQTETLSIAENKKRLETSYEDRKREIEDELALKRREAEQEKGLLEAQNIPLREEKKKLENGNDILQRENAALSSTASTLTAQNTQLEKTKTALQQDVSALSDKKNELTPQVAKLTTDVTALSEEKVGLITSTGSLLVAKDAVVKEHLDVTEAKRVSTEEYAALTAGHKVKKSDLEKELDAILGQINERLGTKLSLDNEVTILEGQLAGKIKDIDEKEKQANDRLAAAARLEATADEKLNHLREVEHAFTTEHLGRFGYKRLTEKK